jgi:hypothetical protein
LPWASARAAGRQGRCALRARPPRHQHDQAVNGAGTLAHEFGHALDHYLGWVSGGGTIGISGWDSVGSFAQGKFEINFLANKHLPLKLRAAVNRLMHDCS